MPACHNNWHDYFGSCILYEQNSAVRRLVKSPREQERSLAAIAGKHDANSMEGISCHRWPFHGNKDNGAAGTENFL